LVQSAASGDDGSHSLGLCVPVPCCLRAMDIDWPFPKRRRVGVGSGLWGEPQTLPEDSALWGLCDALMLYANAHGHAELCPLAEDGEGPRGGSGPAPQALSLLRPRSPLPPSPLNQPPSPLPSPGAGSAPPSPLSGQRASGPGAVPGAPAPEPLLRALTQLANTGAACATTRRQLVVECQVHVPLLRLMQRPWGLQPLVAERCFRLLHWLGVRAPDSREVLGAHRSPCAVAGSARSVSFADAVLGAVEAHRNRSEVLAMAMRSLCSALLPCACVREELARAQPRLLTCLALSATSLDAATLRAMGRWMPGASSQVRKARGESPDTRHVTDMAAACGVGHFEDDFDVDMAD